MKILSIFLLLTVGLSVNVKAQKRTSLKYFEFVNAKADDNLITLAKGESPEILLYTNTDDFNAHIKSLKEKGYLKIGTWIGLAQYKSSVNKKRALKEAKKVGATVVMSSSMFIGTDFYVLQKVVPPEPIVEEPVPATPVKTETLETPEKNEATKIGVEFRNLSIEERRDIERNKGAYVINVIDDLPAFEANIIPGDILIKVNGLEIKDANQAVLFIGAADQSEDLTLTIIRKGSIREIIIKF